MHTSFPSRSGLAVLAVLAGCGIDTADPSSEHGFVPDPPAVYVAKVKNILVGQPPTADELAAVVADPRQLPALIDGWMATPEYQQKMRVFFELAFQQTQITAADFVDLVPTRGLGDGRATALLVQNARESFARTVLELTRQGRPLTEAFTTHRLMMTPALMELYAFLDTRQVNNAQQLNDTFAKANPGLVVVMQTAKGRVPIADTLDPRSPSYMHWYTPDLPGLTYANDPDCNGLDPITFNVSSQAIHALLYGEIPAHQGGASGNCNNRVGSEGSEQVAPEDFTAWRMVTIRPPVGGEPRTRFFDLPALRTASELVLSTPRVGFFSTPAFFANWPTNASNQMRVTANQALIVATGTAVDGGDPTVPDTAPGLDEAHAGDAACRSCHVQLDPTRSILAATYSWFYYPQTDPVWTRQTGLFAFQDVIAPIHTIDDFAATLAGHPRVAQAWAQKLCYYVSSAPCKADDPELQRVVAAFTASGGQWGTLVKELLASPITTHTAPTETSKANGAIVAVSRRDHFCAALNNRLGFVDICQLDATVRGRQVSPIAQIVSGMPSDGYGRGATAPVLPNQPTLFYRAGLENVCAQVASMTIDAPVLKDQPGARRWSSAQADAAIADFVSLVMAMPPGDPRAAQASAILTQHFQSAVAEGAAARDALRSTFVVACLSPSFIGIGM